jgi:hypothetical protein
VEAPLSSGCNTLTISSLVLARELSLSRNRDILDLPLNSFYYASATRLAMDPFDKKPILPVEVMITVAINVAVVMLGYYVMIFWGIIRG